MLIPDHLVYAETHEWVKVEEDGTLAVGITDFGQEQLGPLVYVEMPAVGAQVRRTGECGIVESNKTASDLHAPVDGEVVAINQALVETPDAVNGAPYDQWIFKIRPAAPFSNEGFLDAAGYLKLIS
ncbi:MULTISPECIES: glycine cleavage system protein GcvH [unclassified Herbaspirillum]|uniref:glycine cleavage system protein GcvH n=1 Tax=unclassified Herbaspirillum TaxID=2624150 RepID=UPI001152CE65|nr:MULTISPECIES: glycine cleavage system protein GcvH [unclassified Herbaspirillum]MBB5391006.1 glycine cleavage system H protein [Herbaspirillum sp. SJZ102]TQK13294.1 glycine cleavage system H protein [Herbaspirillum sp. SJZ130]TQK15298.1 glycine cleavage system H protein [Herbaspirillum sp. SJZ106]TWC62607.1 glycine cleavage system H protein [Herbaspirillum sp. SJZ099]